MSIIAIGRSPVYIVEYRRCTTAKINRFENAGYRFWNYCIYPQIPNIPPYHNNAVWPFVQSYFVWAAAKSGNEKAVMQGIANIYRAAALFATNKENMVAQNGDFAGIQINSSNMLWSLSGNISLVHKVMFGLSFEEDGLHFSPFVHEALKGKRTLLDFKYHDATKIRPR